MSERPAPVSRKQRLMAAVGERAAGGGGAPLSCFICGGGIGRGKELKLQVKQPAAGAGTPAQPFFPFLQQQEPAPGARELCPADGCVLVCAVCRCFLGEQWAAFERARTPVDKRMYWLKRPHQCDAGAGGRRGGAGAPREWNIAYALGSGVGDDDEDGGGGRGPHAAAEDSRDSELSELSDAEPLSEPDPAVRDAASSPPVGAPAARVGCGQQWRPLPGHPPGRGAEEEDDEQEEKEDGIPSRLPVEREPKPTARRGRKGLRRPWGLEPRASVLRVIQDPWPGPPGPAAAVGDGKGVPLGRASKPRDSMPLGDPLGGCCTSEDSDINITSEEEDRKEPVLPGPCVSKEKENGGRTPMESRAGPPEGLCCYICGVALSPASQHQIHVQKQEKHAQAPFFPSLWLHSPPPGAQPISPGGSTLVCRCCFSALTQQWRSFELADVPVLQRLYVVPMTGQASGGVTPKGRRPPRDASLGTAEEACYLCGEDCTQDARAVPSRTLNGSSARNIMHFPFLSLLPCPPNARGPNKRCEVRSCPRCFSVLEDVWALYRASRNEELITSVQAFLGRYHQAFAATTAASDPAPPELPAGPPAICYICGAELGPGKQFQLPVNPSGRLGETEPFFPFLTVYPPAPRARPADSTGLVTACVLCYHDLLGQWLQHEAHGPHHAASAWARQYQVGTFVCFFCQREKQRCLGLKPVRVARLPLFLYTLRASRSLLVDDGRQLIIGACLECGTLVCAGQGLARQGPASWSSPVESVTKVTSASLEASAAVRPPAREPEPRPAVPAESLSGGSRTTQEQSPARGQQSSQHEDGADAVGTGMSHEPKSPSLGMLSTATRTTATVNPLTPSPLNGALVPSGSPATSSALPAQAAPSSGFAAALRKLAKQAEEPRGSSLSSEPSPVSSPATNHSSPASTPKRVPMGPIIVPPGGHSVPSTPPVVTIAPTKTVNGVWRSESRQDSSSRGGSSGRERLLVEPPLPQEKAGGPAIPSHLLSTPYPFGISPGSVVQDSRFPPLNLQRPVHHVVPPSTVTEDYLRSFRPYHTAEDLRMSSLPPLSLDPAAAAAYYHPSYLAPHPFPHPAFRMDDSYCLSALRSPFYPIPAPGSLPPLHPSAMHLHLSGVRYPPELAHSSLAALHAERISGLSAERLQMDEELRREREREREADREREKERELERQREEREQEREREKERERQREQRAREKELPAAKVLEPAFPPAAELHVLRGHATEERVRSAEQLTPTRAEKVKEPGLQAPKPVQHPLHPVPAPHHAVPSLISTHGIFSLPGSSAATALLIQRTNEEEKWLARQRRLRQEKEDRQSQVSEFRQQVLEQHLDLGRPPAPLEAEQRSDSARPGPNRHEPGSRDPPQHFGGPPPLISPKPQHHTVPTALWNPVALIDNTLETRRVESHTLHGHSAAFEPSRQAAVPLVKVERVYCPEKAEEPRKREAAPLDKYQPPPREAGSLEPQAFSHGPGPFLADLEKSTQTILGQQRSCLPQATFGELSRPLKADSPYRPPAPRAPDPAYIYDEFLQQRRRLVSKLDLEERRRREAQEKGYYYDLDDSYDESDEEEVRAHLRCVAEQPPLKLDTCSEKLEFLQLFGLTTQQQKEELVAQKRRKRRRMLRERSPSPPPLQSKRQTPSPRLVLSTRYSPEDMNSSPNLEEKKKFLTIFNLTHVSTEKRKEADTQPVPLETDKPVGGAASLSDIPKAVEPGRPEQLRVQEPAPASGEKARPSEAPGGKKSLSMLHHVRGAAPKDIPVPLSHSVNGKSKPWEPSVAEEFAHQFHESVLQSTQKALQRHKAVLSAELTHKADASVRYNIPELQSTGRLPAPQHNGQQEPPAARKGPPAQEMDCNSAEEEEEEEDDEEEEDVPRRKWQGIEAIFEAYQEHIEEQNLERQVLETQCRRLEAQHYSLSLAAEQLSHSMAELRSQKQKTVSERERLQAELDHLRKCLALPAMHWPRGYFKGYPR
ncbi:genetic suppressor element 1 isoform X5 [Ochotona princeps]|uniref:genetic suppressor element 1 isoform X5 n=1 Tax=Ochotona princeps TaxID=9978 RepID=UPI002714F9B5|nr:genetic suppressor element 1 isoform X5 [Ochotona princeps]